MTRVDLDEAQKRAVNDFPADGWVQPTMQALVAELRAARMVIDEAKLQSRPHAYLRKALDVYDKAVSS